MNDNPKTILHISPSLKAILVGILLAIIIFVGGFVVYTSGSILSHTPKVNVTVRAPKQIIVRQVTREVRYRTKAVYKTKKIYKIRVYYKYPHHKLRLCKDLHKHLVHGRCQLIR